MFFLITVIDVDVYAYFSGSVAKLGYLLMQCVGIAYQHIVGWYMTTKCKLSGKDE